MDNNANSTANISTDKNGVISITHLNQYGQTVTEPISNIPGYTELGLDASAPTFHSYQFTISVDPNAELSKQITAQDVFEALTKAPAPFTYSYDGFVTGQMAYVAPLGDVQFSVDPIGDRVTNLTTSNHLLRDGLVTQQAFKDPTGMRGLEVIGLGNGRFASLNVSLSRDVFGFNAERVGAVLNKDVLGFMGITNFQDRMIQRFPPPTFNTIAPLNLDPSFAGVTPQGPVPGFSLSGPDISGSNPTLGMPSGFVGGLPTDSGYGNGTDNSQPAGSGGFVGGLPTDSGYGNGDSSQPAGDPGSASPTGSTLGGIGPSNADTGQSQPSGNPSQSVNGSGDNSAGSYSAMGEQYGADQESTPSTVGNDTGDPAGPSGDPGGGENAPVILDLTGHGIKITPLQQSNTYLKLGTDGYAHHTAWAGAGNAVLFYDPGNTGAINQANQVDFTRWDPTAASDMAALRAVFDTNHNGKLDAGDAGFASFKLMVTNADGTTSVETLAQAGITSINLVPTQANVQQADGSVETGQSTYTRQDGSTGTAADVTLAVDGTDVAGGASVTHNGDGSTTVTQRQLDGSGALAANTVSTASADGSSTTLTADTNGDGIVDTRQTDVITIGNGGTKFETVSDYGHGGAALADRTSTTTSADGTGVSITRDLTGGGITGETENRTTRADGSSTDSVNDISKDGTSHGKQVVTIAAGGLTKTTQVDRAGNGAYNLTSTDATVVAGDGSRTETVTDKNGDNSLRDSSVTTISANGLTKSVKTDHAGSGTADLVETSQTVVNGDGSTNTTVVDTNANGSMRGRLPSKTVLRRCWVRRDRHWFDYSAQMAKPTHGKLIVNNVRDAS